MDGWFGFFCSWGKRFPIYMALKTPIIAALALYQVCVPEREFFVCATYAALGGTIYMAGMRDTYLSQS